MSPLHQDRQQALAATLAALRTFVERSGCTIVGEQPLQGGYQLRVSDGFVETPISLYASGRALIQGKPSELRHALEAWWQSWSVASDPVPSAAAPSTTSAASAPRIGMDESGKGDYFGPLVVAAVFADSRIERELRALGVQDSKRLSDGQIGRIERDIQQLAPHHVVVIGPRRYNQLYQQIGNLNALLAWGHARALETLLAQVSCERAIADQFGDQSYLLNALLERGRQISLEQRPRAEQDAAVAAASVLARAAFVRRIEQLSRQLGLKLPKGSSNPMIVDVARAIVARGGHAALADVAKLHFKTTAALPEGL